MIYLENGNGVYKAPVTVYLNSINENIQNIVRFHLTVTVEPSAIITESGC